MPVPFIVKAKSRRSVALLFALAACASGAPPEPLAPHRDESPWPITTREHVDIWLHGFAMVQDDTARVPFFVRGYRERMSDVKRRANVSTGLDVNRETLRAQLANRPGIINAQFLAMYFGSWRDLQRATELFLQADGDPRRSSDPQIQAVIATFANVFPARADREWLRLFVTSLRDEYDRFYASYWAAQQRDRAPVLARLDTLWESTYRPRLQGYLNNTQLMRGAFILSLPIGGEGRTVTQTPPGAMVVTTFPEQPGNAAEAIYVFVHEVSIPMVQIAVDDHITPAERRDGVATRYLSLGTVRAGAMLLERVSPDLLDGYMRFYLRAAGLQVPAGDPRTAFANAFPLPEQIRLAINAQLDVVMGGI